jgi:hypothetical protein
MIPPARYLKTYQMSQSSRVCPRSQLIAPPVDGIIINGISHHCKGIKDPAQVFNVRIQSFSAFSAPNRAYFQYQH